MNPPSFHPPYRPARGMNPGAALLAALLAITGIEALAAQALSRARPMQVAAPAPPPGDARGRLRSALHAEAPPPFTCEGQPPFCTPFHCN